MSITSIAYLAPSVENARLSSIQDVENQRAYCAENEILKPKGDFTISPYDKHSNQYVISTNSPKFYDGCNLANYFLEAFCSSLLIDDECNIIVCPWSPIDPVSDINYLIEHFDHALVYVPKWEAFQAKTAEKTKAYALYLSLSEEADKLHDELIKL